VFTSGQFHPHPQSKPPPPQPLQPMSITASADCGTKLPNTPKAANTRTMQKMTGAIFLRVEIIR
jgi:hypothetical protein